MRFSIICPIDNDDENFFFARISLEFCFDTLFFFYDHDFVILSVFVWIASQKWFIEHKIIVIKHRQNNFFDDGGGDGDD